LQLKNQWTGSGHAHPLRHIIITGFSGFFGGHMLLLGSAMLECVIIKRLAWRASLNINRPAADRK